MNAVKLISRSNRQLEDRPWLKEKVYDPKRRRTVDLVARSVDSLMKDRSAVSLAALSARSKEIDPDRKGISEAAILKNEEARICYEQHRSWKAASGSRARTRDPNTKIVPARITSDRDAAHVRYRYLKLTKAELVERLLAVENAHAVLQERWLQLNEEILDYQLRAERPQAQPRPGEERS
jgi:hypothetical protein